MYMRDKSKLALLLRSLRGLLLTLTLSSIVIAAATLIRDLGTTGMGTTITLHPSHALEHLCYFTERTVSIYVISDSAAFKGILEVIKVGGETLMRQEFTGEKRVTFSGLERGFYIARILSNHDKVATLALRIMVERELEENLIYLSLKVFLLSLVLFIGLDLLLRRKSLEHM